MAGLDRGPGVLAWEQDHQATPLGPEVYQPPDFAQSITREQIADSTGQPVEVLVVYDKPSGSLRVATFPDGDGSAPASPPSIEGLLTGFDIGFPAGAGQLQGVIAALQAAWCLVYLPAPFYRGGWTRAMAAALAPALPAGFLPCYVGNQAGAALDYVTGQQHGYDAVVQAARFGLDVSPSTVLFLDVEAETPAQRYAAGWIAAVRQAGAEAGIYGSRTFLDYITSAVSPAPRTYCAAWDGSPSAEGYDVHQYRGVTTVAGAGVDLDIARVAAGFHFAKLAA